MRRISGCRAGGFRASTRRFDVPESAGMSIAIPAANGRVLSTKSVEASCVVDTDGSAARLDDKRTIASALVRTRLIVRRAVNRSPNRHVSLERGKRRAHTALAAPRRALVARSS